MTDKNTEPETTEYRLQDGVERVVRADLVLEGDETIDDPAVAEAHDDVLEPVDDETAEEDTDA